MIELGNLSKVDRGEKHILPLPFPPPPRRSGEVGTGFRERGRMKGSGMRSNGSDHCS